MFLVESWHRLGAGAKIAFAVALVALAGGLIAAMFWVFNTPYEVLFSNLSPEDASVMTAELDKMKVPYHLEAGGGAILVPADQTLRTRMKLVGKNLPLHGAVGFEIFNNSDFGMTDFAQKINYQRALQGEIARTILSVDGVQSARVLLVLPDSQVYRRAQVKPKASVSLTLKDSGVLRREQVDGIQRLVSAAVPDIGVQDVSIVDQRGISLTSHSDATDGGSPSDAGLELKKQTEDYISSKLNALLAQSFGANKAVASVDVSLDMDRVHTTTEDVIPASAPAGGVRSAGVLIRERESKSGDSHVSPLPPLPGNGAAETVTDNSQHEAEYQVGRRVRDVFSSPGAIRRITVAAVVNVPMDASQLAQIRTLLTAASGMSSERGDTVAVYSMNQIPSVASSDTVANASVEPAAANLVGHESAHPIGRLESLKDIPPRVVGGLGALLIAFLGAIVLASRRTKRSAGAVSVSRLSDAQRRALQSRVEHWIAGDGVSARSIK